MKVYFIRHGETELNRMHILQGHIDTELNSEGIHQASLARDLIKKKSMKFDQIFCSPLKRAVQTAEIVTERNMRDFELRKELIEIDYGPYDGQPIKYLDRSMMNFLMNPEKADIPAGVESLHKVYERCGNFLEELSEYNYNSVLIVSHGIAIRSMFTYIRNNNNNTANSWWDFQIDNCEMFCSCCNLQKYSDIKEVFTIKSIK